MLKTSFFPYKYRKNKSNFGKNSLEENLGGGGKIHKPNFKKKFPPPPPINIGKTKQILGKIA